MTTFPAGRTLAWLSLWACTLHGQDSFHASPPPVPAPAPVEYTQGQSLLLDATPSPQTTSSQHTPLTPAPQVPHVMPSPAWETLYIGETMDSTEPPLASVPDGAEQQPEYGMEATYHSSAVDSDGTARSAMLSVATPQQNADCCPCPRIWVSAEYVHWWTSGDTLPPLATTSPTGTLQADAGRLGLPTTSILFGDEDVSDGSRSGARFTLGGWLALDRRVGFDLTFLTLANDETQLTAGTEHPIIARPFFNLLGNQQDAQFINFPSVVAGNFEASIRNKFYAGTASLRKATRPPGSFQLDWLLGYRIAGLDDDIRITTNSEALAAPIAGTQFLVTDQFRTRNTFHGVDLGLNYTERVRNQWYVDVLGRVALGTNRTRTDIQGRTVTTVGAIQSTDAAGLLAQATNQGSWISDDFATVSEVGLHVRRHLCNGLSVKLGYSFFYWQDVSRAGEQMDLSINTSQIPPGTLNGDARPQVPDAETNFWAHGFLVGVDYVF